MTTTREAALEAVLRRVMAEPLWRTNDNTLWPDMTAAISTPATEPEYVAGQLEMERKVLAVMSDLLVASDLLNERWKARSKIVSARLFEHAATMQTIREALAARPAPQPAADTRVVAAALWREEAVNAGAPDSVAAGRTITSFAEQSPELQARWCKFAACAIRAIIGTATPAQPDKIAEAARERMARALREYQMQGHITVDWDKVPKSQRKKWFDLAYVAMRALAGKGE